MVAVGGARGDGMMVWLIGQCKILADLKFYSLNPGIVR